MILHRVVINRCLLIVFFFSFPAAAAVAAAVFAFARAVELSELVSGF